MNEGEARRNIHFNWTLSSKYTITYTKKFFFDKNITIFCSYLENSFFVYSILVLSKQLPFSCKVGLTFDISCGDPTMHATR